MDARVLSVNAAYLGITPKGSKFIKLLCELDDTRELYQTLFLTEKTRDNSLKSLVKYGFKGTISEIGEMEDGKNAASLFNVPESGIEVIVENREYTDKASGEEKSVTQIECIKGFGFKKAGVDKKDIPKFKEDDFELKKIQADKLPLGNDWTEPSTEDLPI